MQDNSLHRKHFYTQKLYTQTLLHTDPFTHRHFYTQSFYPQKLLHTEAFTHIRFHTEAFTHRHFYTDTLTHNPFTRRSFYTQKLLQTYAFTQMLLHTDTFTHRHFYNHPPLKMYFRGGRGQVKKNTFTVLQEFDSPGPPLNTLFDRWVYVKCRIHGSGYPTPSQDLLFWGGGLIHFTGLVFPGSPGMFNFFLGNTLL